MNACTAMTTVNVWNENKRADIRLLLADDKSRAPKTDHGQRIPNKLLLSLFFEGEVESESARDSKKRRLLVAAVSYAGACVHSVR